MRAYDVATTAVSQAMELGLGDDPEQLVDLLAQFARRSAIVTHPRGNRRYGGYVLDVSGPRIYGVYAYDNRRVCRDCHGTRRHRMRDGGRWVDVPCQACIGESS